MTRIIGSHEFIRADAPDVWVCEHCSMQAVEGHFDGVADLPCTYQRDEMLET